MYLEKDLKLLREDEREMLLKEEVAKTKAKIYELKSLIYNVSAVSVNTMSISSNCRESLEYLLGEMSRVEDEENCYYNG